MYLGAGAPEGNAEGARYQRAVALTRLGAEGALEAPTTSPRQAPRAPAADALWEAGSLLLRRGDHPAPSTRFERLAVGYPAPPGAGRPSTGWGSSSRTSAAPPGSATWAAGAAG